MSDKGGEFLAGFVIGALVGAAAALLYAPRSGDEMRRQIEERGIELKRQAEHLADEARQQAGELQERGRIVLTDKVKQAQHAIQEAQTKLAQADEGAKS